MILLNVHSKEECLGSCPIHKPSDHHMVSWPLHWRQDRGFFERICQHGIGHPDPDSLKYYIPEPNGIHGCDGCCNRNRER